MDIDAKTIATVVGGGLLGALAARATRKQTGIKTKQVVPVGGLVGAGAALLISQKMAKPAGA